ncbi:MAG: histidinol dehydrogenase [Bacillota bacterium]|jgi:histidinol dehydrogenase|nr:histidinol dehydrogenase [Bacillota bacterium]NLM07827.1 histidinol dehydrogenase [Clostridiales Family XIII bacterium]
MRIVKCNQENVTRLIREMKSRAKETDRQVSSIVGAILEDVQENGDEAVRRYEKKFSGAYSDPFEVPEEELKKAFDLADERFKRAISNAASNIREYHEKQIVEGYEINRGNGAVVGQVVRGLDRIGIYVPCGTAAYPSTVLMNAIPAKLAEVGEIIMLTPPEVQEKANGTFGLRANPGILAAAYVAGVDRVFLAGGAQAIGAMAYGTESIPAVDKIVGPGNIYVATAKKLVYGTVDIDMIAGPSEILIIADGVTNPRFVAADLLSQAEHDPMSAAILLTTNQEVAEKTLKQLEEQAAKLERYEILSQSLENYGLILICESEDEMIDIANRIAPEHLEIMTADPMAVLPGIRNAGSVFCGSYSPEPLGDYYSGTNHVLPTMGTARFASPLGVHSFIKKMSYTFYTKEALEECREDVIAISEKEGLTAHGRAVSIRFENYLDGGMAARGGNEK